MDPKDREAIDRLNKSLRTIKVLLGFFALMLIATLAMVGYVTYKVVTFTRDVNNKIDKFQSQAAETLDVKSQLCKSETLENFLRNNSDICR